MRLTARYLTDLDAARVSTLALFVLLAALCSSAAEVPLDSEVILSGEGPLLPRASDLQSAHDLIPPPDDFTQPKTRSVVLSAEGTEDEREGEAVEETTSTLRAFLDEMLSQGTVWSVLHRDMGVKARRTFLEDRSIRSYREGILRFPDSPFVPSAHMRIAEIYARRGEWRAALNEYATLLKRFPKADVADGARLARARLLLDGGDFPAARDEAYLLIDSYLESPLQVDAYLLAGEAHESLGELDRAALAFAHVEHLAVHGSASDVRAREGLASVELALGRTEEATRVYEELLAEAQSQSERDTRQFALARLYLDGGETERARALLRGILYGYDLNAYRPAAAFMLADSYYADGRMAEALKYYAVALVDFPTYAERIPALFRASEAYKRLALYDEALEALRLVPKAHDPGPTPHEVSRSQMLAGEVLLLDGKWAAALEELYGAAAGDITSAERDEVLYWIAESYYRAGYYNEALEAYDVALGRAPEHPRALEATRVMATCYAKRGWLDDARQKYVQIVDGAAEDDTPERLAIRSRAAIQLLDSFSDRDLYQDELRWAQWLLDKNVPLVDEAEVVYRMGRDYERLNNPDRAEALYADVQRRFPGTTWAQQAAAKSNQISIMKQIRDVSR